MAVRLLPKQITRVRFSYPAPKNQAEIAQPVDLPASRLVPM